MSTEKRRGDWLQTFTGRQFWPLDPRPEEVDILDIAHALSQQCRFAGHTRVFYSVAEHCVRVSLACDPKDALAGLLHDAAEAYVVDVPRPLKRHLPDYRAIEAVVHHAIATRFWTPDVLPVSVQHADNVLLATEARDLMSRPTNAWAPMPLPLDEWISPWSSALAKERFLARFADLGGTAL